jgi:hypothetical protein
MITAAIASFCMLLGVGFGMLLHGRKPNKEQKPASSVSLLMEQTHWLPVARITHRRRDELGYPALKGTLVATLELEGGINLIAEDKAINSAFLDYNGTRIGLNPDRRAGLGRIFKDRVAELAMANAEVKLLGP